MYNDFEGLPSPCVRIFLHLVSYKMLNFSSFFNLNWTTGQKMIMKVSPTDAGDFGAIFSLMRENLHAWRESGRNLVSRRETPSQCGRVGSPAKRHVEYHVYCTNWPGYACWTMKDQRRKSVNNLQFSIIWSFHLQKLLSNWRQCYVQNG